GLAGAGGALPGVGRGEHPVVGGAASATGAQRSADLRLPPAGVVAAGHRAGRRALGRAAAGAMGHLRPGRVVPSPAVGCRADDAAARGPDRAGGAVRAQPGGVRDRVLLVPEADAGVETPTSGDGAGVRHARAGGPAPDVTDAVTDDAAATSRRAATPTTDTSPAGTTRSGAGSFAPARNGYLLVALAALLWALLG